MAEWIKVSERLPTENGSYLVVGLSKKPYAAHFYKDRTIFGKFFPAHFSNSGVTHWMPLPPPPPEAEK